MFGSRGRGCVFFNCAEILLCTKFLVDGCGLAKKGDLKVESINIEVEPREVKNGRETNRLRKTGFIPSVIYAKGGEGRGIKLPINQFMSAASKSRTSQVFVLKSSDKALDGQKAIVREVQRDFLKGTVLHVDFQQLKDNEVVRVRIPLRITGEADGVKNEGGVLEVNVRDVAVRCLPKDILSELVIDISSLKMGQGIKAKELKLAAGVLPAEDPDETIVSVVASRTSQQLEAATAAAAEGAAAVPAEGEAAAAGAAPAAGAEAGKAAAGAEGAKAAPADAKAAGKADAAKGAKK